MIRPLFVALVLMSQLSSQTKPLNGHVLDERGAAVPGAIVRLVGPGASTSTTSGPLGEFTMNVLSTTSAILTVERGGFRRESIRLEEGTREIVVILKVAGIDETIVVTAEATPQLMNETSKALTTLSSNDIKARSEYAIAEILRNVPGIQISNSGGPGQNTNFRIRGLRPDAAAVLVDGLRFRDASTTQADASSFISALNFVSHERVEVVRGSGSSLYGTNAAAGVINLVSAEGGSPLHGDFQVEGGNLGLFRTRGQFGGGFSDIFKYTVGLSHLYVSEGVDGNDANRSTAVQARTSINLSKRLNLGLRFLGSTDFVSLNISPTASSVPPSNIPAQGVVGAVPLSPAEVNILNIGGKPIFGATTFVPGRDDPDNQRTSRFGTAAILLKHNLSDFADWQATYQRVGTSRVFQNGPLGTGSQPAALSYTKSLGVIHTADVRLNVRVSRAISLSGGYEFESERYFNRQNNNLLPPRLILATTNVTQNSHAGYFASRFSLLEGKLQVAISGRAQIFSLSQPTFDFSGTTSAYAGLDLPSPPKALTADVSLSYFIPTPSIKFRAHAGNAYRAPALFERFGGGFSANPANGIVSFTAFGDPRLSPDRYNSIDGGVDQYLFGDRVRLSATAFYSRVVSITAFDSSGVIRPATDPFGRTQGYLNGSGGISRGVELGMEAKPISSLSITGGYTYVNANTDRDVTVLGFWKVMGVQSHVLTVNVNRQWNNRFSTNLDLFHGSKYYASFFAAGRSRAFLFPGFTKADIVGRYYVWKNNRRSAIIYAKVENFLNQRYYQNGWLAPGATFVTGLGYSF